MRNIYIFQFKFDGLLNGVVNHNTVGRRSTERLLIKCLKGGLHWNCWQDLMERFFDHIIEDCQICIAEFSSYLMYRLPCVNSSVISEVVIFFLILLIFSLCSLRSEGFLLFWTTARLSCFWVLHRQYTLKFFLCGITPISFTNSLLT